MARKPQPPKSKGGRPEYRPSINDRTAVERMKYAGESENTIALSLNIDVRTLRKHFDYELAQGHANRRRQIIELLFEAAQAGNVSAQKQLNEMGKASGAADRVKARGRPAAAAPKLGKKEIQQARAESVEGPFAPPSPPKLIVNNK